MKSLITIGVLAASGLAQTAQFTNTSFAGPFTVGQTVSVMWTTGNGLPISLSITNSTWGYKVFSDRAVLPTTFAWTIAALPGLAAGNYQLALEQANGGRSNSPVFEITLSGSPQSSMTTSANPAATATVTYVYWDDSCGCKKTGTIASPINTGLPATTTTWWDHKCSCHMSAIVPVSTMPSTNNYTIPALPPPMPTTAAPSAAPGPSTTTASSAQPTFTGGAVKFGNSICGMLAMIAALAIAS